MQSKLAPIELNEVKWNEMKWRGERTGMQFNETEWNEKACSKRIQIF